MPVPTEFDVDVWLAKQRKADEPELGMWGWFGETGLKERMRDQLNTMVAQSIQLLSYADPTRLDKRNHDGAHDELDWTRLMRPLKKSGVKAYYFADGIVIDLNSEVVTLDFVYQGGVTLRRAHGVDYLGVLLETWRCGGPNARRARAFLCDVLAQDVAKAKSQAARDLHDAVAMSDDGKRIALADYVMMFDGGEWITLPSNRFTDKKILLSDRYGRHKVSQPLGYGQDACRAALRAIKVQRKGGPFVIPGRPGWGEGPRSCDQALVSYKEKGVRERVFMTTIQYCPDPLPDPDFQEILRVA